VNRIVKALKLEWIHELSGKSVVCIASGPSLAIEDCELVRASGLPTIVTNTTYQRCPWASVLVGHDDAWWMEHHREVSSSFHGRKIACQSNGRRWGAQSLKALKFKSFRNSGAAAISLAAFAGAKRVILLGFDCQKTNGQTHWHGDHPPTLGNAGTMPRWAERIADAGKYAKSMGCEVVNATRETALECFPRVQLEECLA
jgi:hypothetical protein